MAAIRHFILVTMMGVLPALAYADTFSILRGGTFGATGQSLIQHPNIALVSIGPLDSADRGNGSLFAGRQGRSLFAPVQPRAPDRVGPADAVAKLRDLIASAEAGAMQYDAVQHGATRQPPGPPTALRIQDIYGWISATPGQPHAIGRYQFIPATLRRLVDKLGIPSKARFSPEVQDLLADELLREAGLDDFLTGKLGAPGFQDNLAKIWAGLPARNGKSVYDGFAGNKATMTRAAYDAAFAQIFAG